MARSSVAERAARAATSPRTLGSNGSAVLSLSRLSRVVQRWTPSMVQSCRPATPSAQPSQTPLVSTSSAYLGWRRLSQATWAMSR